jgi:tripeptide aminopeptidase
MKYNSLVELFLQLVKIDAVSLQERPVADFIKRKFQQWPIDVFEDQAGQQLGGQCGNLIIRLPENGRSEPPLLLLAHMDTVHSTAGVQVQEQDGVLRSDGRTILGVDNRAGLALILHLVQEIMEKNLPHPPLEIVFTVAEELGMLGALALDTSQLSARQGFVFDCTAVPGGYVASTPTAYDFKIQFQGRPAHSAVAPEKGINALTMALEMMNGFPVGRINEHTVANIGTVHGGSADNVVPDVINVTGEFRSFRDEEIARLQQQVQHLCRTSAEKYGGQCEPSFILSFQGFHFSSDMPLVSRLHRAYDKVGVAPDPLVYYGGSDANVFNGRGIQVINTGIGANNPHSHEEHISIADFNKGYEVLLHLIDMERV